MLVRTELVQKLLAQSFGLKRKGKLKCLKFKRTCNLGQDRSFKVEKGKTLSPFKVQTCRSDTNISVLVQILKSCSRGS